MKNTDDERAAQVAQQLGARIRDARQRQNITLNGYTYNLSSGDLPDQQMSAFELTFPPGEKVHPKFECGGHVPR
jgi:hypothetical protein